MEQDLDRVRCILGKLEEARSKGLACFGSDSHGFRMNPPIGEDELLAFEREQGLRLPEDYRTFLLHAGNGGAGPYYGIFPLEKWSDFADWVMDDRPADFLARPCPLTPDLEPTENWAEQFGDDAPYEGTLSIGTQGCTYGMQLIVSGPYAGRVLYTDADGNPPYMVRDPDFLSWYERWLDELLAGKDVDYFGYGLGGGEEEFLRILGDPRADDDLRADAAFGFCRLPGLSPSAAAQLPAYLHDPVAKVREGVCAVVRTFQLDDATDDAAVLLEDESAAVRRQAVWTVMELAPGRWSGAVLQRLREDSDEGVAESAFFKLKDAGALSKPELLRILDRTEPEGLRYLAAHAVEWAAENSELLVRLLSDPHEKVRFYATLGLRQVGAKGSLPQVLDLLNRETDGLVIGSVLRMLGEFGDPFAVPVLLEWTEATDDFHRLEAMEALAKIGDERAVPVAKAMLREDRPPVRRDASGFIQQTSVHTIAQLVRKGLECSPNRALRRLVKRPWNLLS